MYTRLSQGVDETWNQLVMSYDGADATFYLNKDRTMTEENLGGTFVLLSSASLHKSHLCSIEYFIFYIHTRRAYSNKYFKINSHCQAIIRNPVYLRCLLTVGDISCFVQGDWPASKPRW